MKIISAVVVGAGDRGNIYASYSLKHQGELKIVGVVDINENAKKNFAKKYNLQENQQFSNIYDFISSKTKCDIVIVTTMDNDHVKIAKILIQNGYDILLEKPITSNKKELMDLLDEANKFKTKVIVCHVLRYTPFYSGIKAQIDSGAIGKIISINIAEHVGVLHFISSYVNGKWDSIKKCGSSFLLAKSCHDLDLLCWLNNTTIPKNVVSFANRNLFISKNAPSKDVHKCLDCPSKDTCPYSVFGGRTTSWKENGEKEEDIIAAYNKIDGECVYNDKDICDRQHLMLEFENGSLANFELIGGAPKAERTIDVIGEKGEITGSFEDNEYKVIKYNFHDAKNETSVFNVSDKLKDIIGGHRGGDNYLMHDLIRFLNNEPSPSITKLSDSIYSHLCVYAADESVLNNKIIKIN